MRSLPLVLVLLAAVSCSKKNVPVDDPGTGYDYYSESGESGSQLPECNAIDYQHELDELCGFEGGEACLKLGNLYYEGLECRPDHAAAALAYEQGCYTSDESCYMFALMIERGDNPDISDIEVAISLYSETCWHGHEPSCTRMEELEGQPGESGGDTWGDIMGTMSLMGSALGSTSLEEEAPEEETTADEQWMQDQATAMLADTATEPGTDTAPESQEERCDAGHAFDCEDIAYKYFLEGNKSKSAVYFEKACDIGLANSCGLLGYLLYVGDGVKQDVKRAAKNAKVACDEGLEEFCSIATASTPFNTKKAKTFPAQCEGGIVFACMMAVAQIIDSTSDVEDSEVHHEMAKYLFKACELGHKETCKDIREMLLDVRTMDPEIQPEAEDYYPYYGQSCDLGFEEFCADACNVGYSDYCGSKKPSKTEKKDELTVADVDTINKKNKSDIRECYKEHFEKHPKANFDVALNLKVDKKGSAKKTTLFTSDEYPVAYCILHAVRNWQFPESKTGLEVMYGWKAKKFK